jgi:hypothetical protein
MTRQSLYLGAWIASHVIFITAWTFTPYPNQIMWSYTGATLCLAVLLFGERAFAKGSFFELTGLIGLYYAAFFVVSFWEVFPGTTIVYGKFELLHIVTAANWYVLGRMVPARRMLKGYYWTGLLLMGFSLLQLTLLPDSSRFTVPRYGYGEQLMLCLPAMLFQGNYWIAAGGLIVMLSSLHKTPMMAAFLGMGLTVLLCWRYLPRSRGTGLSRNPRYAMLRPVVLMLGLAVGLSAATLLSNQIVNSVARFLPESVSIDVGGETVAGEGEDLTRTYQIDRSRDLLAVYWIRGMGYMNFMLWTGRDLGYGPMTRFDREEAGISLHNSFMTWTLEGGLLVSCVMLAMFYRTGTRIRRLVRNPEFRAIGLLCIAWVASIALLGWYHQIHYGDQLWGTIGLIYGLSDSGSKVT